MATGWIENNYYRSIADQYSMTNFTFHMWFQVAYQDWRWSPLLLCHSVSPGSCTEPSLLLRRHSQTTNLRKQRDWIIRQISCMYDILPGINNCLIIANIYMYHAVIVFEKSLDWIIIVEEVRSGRAMKTIRFTTILVLTTKEIPPLLWSSDPQCIPPPKSHAIICSYSPMASALQCYLVTQR
jgi:hypothetical protein